MGQHEAFFPEPWRGVESVTKTDRPVTPVNPWLGPAGGHAPLAGAGGLSSTRSGPPRARNGLSKGPDLRDYAVNKALIRKGCI